MPQSRRSRRPNLRPEHYATENPFANWYASYWRHGAARYLDRPGLAIAGDLMMGELASTRFAIGMGADRVPVLGIAEGDYDAIMSLEWKGAAFLRRVQMQDWVALSCPDARIEGGGCPTPTSLRLWLPCENGLLDGWIGAEPAPTSLRLLEVEIRRGKPFPKEGAAHTDIPLTFKGSWVPEQNLDTARAPEATASGRADA